MKRILTVGPKSGWWSGGVGIGYLRPDQFLDHLTVIITRQINANMIQKLNVVIKVQKGTTKQKYC